MFNAKIVKLREKKNFSNKCQCNRKKKPQLTTQKRIITKLTVIKVYFVGVEFTQNFEKKKNFHVIVEIIKIWQKVSTRRPKKMRERSSSS